MSKIVLCVDDSATMQQVADITFRGTEFTYVGARSYDEALTKAKGQKPAIVLADSQMPGKSGYDLCMALKSDAATANVPVVILVGNGAPFDQAKGTQVGVDANLPKPWDTQTMLEKVTEVVAKAASGVAKPGTAAAGATAGATAPIPVAATPAAAKPGPAAAAAAAAAAATANQPPRSATIMGMPTIKMPAGVAPTATAQPAAPAPTKTTVMSAATPMRAPAASAPAVAPAAATPAVSSSSSAASAAPALAMSGTNRVPMISGTPTKRSVLVERTLAKMASKLAEAAGIEPGSPELLALLKLSTEVVERIVWEVVPELAEQIIRENLQDLTKKRGAS
ncbi:MAG: response regulator [Myxococcota bacterium]|nr:response regulator [Myxococcota bacterium]